MDILEFKDEFRWLSNFWPAPVMLDGVQFDSVEHAYQAAKTTPENRQVFIGCTPGQAKRRGRTVPIRPEWGSVKVETMRSLLAQKFAQGTELGNRLAALEGKITEGNDWGDTFWGVCRGVGENWLGRLLMEQRACLTPNASGDRPAATAGTVRPFVRDSDGWIRCPVCHGDGIAPGESPRFQRPCACCGGDGYRPEPDHESTSVYFR